MDTHAIIALAEVGFEVAGVATIVIGTLVALANCALGMRRAAAWPTLYRPLRAGIGRSILLGLELLVAADIIRTVALDPTLANIGILGLIVLIRTFLSWSLEVEITGEPPWRRAAAVRDKDEAQKVSDL
jgi:uncharacterized membrane protein